MTCLASTKPCYARLRSPSISQTPARSFWIAPKQNSAKGRSRLSVFALLANSEAPTLTKADPVDDAITAITSGVQSAGKAIKSGLGAVETAGGYVKKAADTVAPAVKTAADTTAPLAKKAAGLISDAASPVLKAAGDAIPAAGGKVEKLLSQQGIDTRPVVDAGSKAAKTVGPAAGKLLSWFLSQPLLTQAEALGAAAAAAYLAPPLLGALAGALQGYRGDLSAPAALNLISTARDSTLVDIRAVSEKETSGVPDLPGDAAKRLVELEYDVTEDKKLRGQFANPSAVESKVTALKIAALKRTKRGSPIVLLDKNGSLAKTVAKELAKQGYSKVFIVNGGFDGRGGWVQSKLKTSLAKTFSTATVVETVLPTTAKPGLPSQQTGTGSKTVKKLPPRNTRSLPSPKK